MGNKDINLCQSSLSTHFRIEIKFSGMKKMIKRY